MTLLGIDVSHFQGSVDWFSVARSNVKFAFAKATEGNVFRDDRFEANWRGMQDAGLFRGAYHFGRPGRDAETQAEHFASIVGPLGFRDLPPVLDIEESDGRPPEQVLSWIRAFIVRAEALFQRRLIIYTGVFWREALGNNADPFFGERPLWVAAYRKVPVIPAAWKEYTFWQYSEGRSNSPVAVSGVGPCDQNRFEGSEADLNALCSSVAPGASPVVVPPASPTEFPGFVFIWPKSPAIQGDAVRRWQQRLSELGYSVEVDGVYGPESKSACSAFQRDHGLSADGIVGLRTWTAAFA